MIEDKRVGEREPECGLDKQSRDENTKGITCGRFEISQTSHTFVGIQLLNFPNLDFNLSNSLIH